MKCIGWRLPAVLLVALLFLACEKDPSRLEKRAPLPFGSLDVPNAASVELDQGAPLTLSGWAVSEDGIAEVNVYVDRRLVRSSGTLLLRPDVGKTYPGIPGSDRSGFYAILEPSEIGAGAHEVVLQVRTTRKAVRELGRFTVVAHP